MESWRQVWREGVAPLLPNEGLGALRAALAADDAAVIQGGSCSGADGDLGAFDPGYWSGEVVAACPVCYALWRGRGLRTIADVEGAFAELSHAVDTAALSLLLRWIDEAPRAEMRHALLLEVERTLEDRERQGVTP